MCIRDRFARVDDLQMLHAVFPAEPAHDARERADGGFINICHAEGGGVYLVARAHGADDRNARLLCGKHQPHFARDGVDGVDHVVILREIKLRFFSGQEKDVYKRQALSRGQAFSDRTACTARLRFGECARAFRALL